MRKQKTLRFCVIFVVTLYCALHQNLYAQGYGSALTMQGVNHLSMQSASSRSLGGISVGSRGDASLMFMNPASLQSIEEVNISLGGLWRSTSAEQKQNWNPLSYYPTFSLMMEGLLDSIRNPDWTEVPVGGFGPEDSIARPYDKIKPNWSKKKQKGYPLQAFAVVPVQIGGMEFVGGIGVVEYANMNYYFQNNNVLDPSIGSQRPYSYPLPNIGIEVPVKWSQVMQSRDGSIYGYGGALSMNVAENISVGISGLVLSGSSDDFEQTVSRGTMRFGNHDGAYYLSLDSTYSIISSVGTSDFSGTEFTMCSSYFGKYISLNISLKSPTTITRKFSTTVKTDTTGTPGIQTINGEDKITFPWRGFAGLSLKLRENLSIGFEYEILPYADAKYVNPAGVSSKPWLSSSIFKVGVEFLPVEWFALRFGYHDEAEVFQEEGNALLGEPVKYTVYTGGIGFVILSVHLNIAYEYSIMKYQDMWQTNVNLNKETCSTVIADVAYTIPW